MRKDSKKGSRYWEERQGLNLVLSTTWPEGNTRNRDHAHRHEKSQGGIFQRVGAVEAAILYILLCGHFKRSSIWGSLVFFSSPSAIQNCVWILGKLN